MTFGMVLGFLEGRVQSEALASGLCCSFIVADGFMKSLGAWLLAAHVPPQWMPAVAGFIFLAPTSFFAWMLSRIPPPNRQDQAERCERVQMNGQARWAFFLHYALGLSLLAAVYLLATVLRSIRADFAPEIWSRLGVVGQPEKYARSETLVAVIVTVLSGAIVFMRNNRKAFFVALLMAVAGFVISIVALWCQGAGLLSPFVFMVLSGLGIYFPYIAMQTCVFERLIAMTRAKGNIGFLVYLVDSFGYLGYFGVMLLNGILKKNGDVFELFMTASWLIAGASIGMLVWVWRYFANHSTINAENPSPAAGETMALV
jgi:hypothetical protein